MKFCNLMSLSKILFLIGTVVLFAGCAWSVEILTDSTFNQKVSAESGQNVWFVKFYAPWCGHCKKLAPTWDQLGNTLASSSTKVAKVDCTIEKAVCKRFGIRGFPTLIMIDPVNEKMYSYNGGRGLNDLVSFARYEDGAWRKASANSLPDPNALPMGDFRKDLSTLSVLFEREFGFSIYWLVAVLGSLFVLLVVVMCIFIFSADTNEVENKKKKSTNNTDDNGSAAASAESSGTSSDSTTTATTTSKPKGD